MLQFAIHMSKYDDEWRARFPPVEGVAIQAGNNRQPAGGRPTEDAALMLFALRELIKGRPEIKKPEEINYEILHAASFISLIADFTGCYGSTSGLMPQTMVEITRFLNGTQTQSASLELLNIKIENVLSRFLDLIWLSEAIGEQGIFEQILVQKMIIFIEFLDHAYYSSRLLGLNVIDFSVDAEIRNILGVGQRDDIKVTPIAAAEHIKRIEKKFSQIQKNIGGDFSEALRRSLIIVIKRAAVIWELSNREHLDNSQSELLAIRIGVIVQTLLNSSEIGNFLLEFGDQQQLVHEYMNQAFDQKKVAKVVHLFELSLLAARKKNEKYSHLFKIAVIIDVIDARIDRLREILSRVETAAE